MNNLVVINNCEVSFEVVGSEAFTTSIDIANVFEKQHKHIIAKIEAISDISFRQTNFRPSSELRKNGLFMKETKFYKITKNGFIFLVSGFTGEKAERWKIEFIEHFKKLTLALRISVDEYNKLQEKYKALQQTAINSQNEMLAIVQEKSSQADEYKQKYYESIERENELLRNALSNANAKYKGTRLSQSEKEKIIKLYEQGLSLAQIGKKVNRSDSAVSSVIKKHTSQSLF